MKNGGFGPETVAVAPTSTTVVDVDVRHVSVYALYLKNLDGTQTFSGTVKRYMVTGQTPAPTPEADFSSVAPGEAAFASLDVRGTAFLSIVGTMSGAGGNVSISGSDR